MNLADRRGHRVLPHLPRLLVHRQVEDEEEDTLERRQENEENLENDVVVAHHNQRGHHPGAGKHTTEDGHATQANADALQVLHALAPRDLDEEGQRHRRVIEQH